MNQLEWNEYDVIECLGVLPDFDSFFTFHTFRLEKDELILEMTIWQYENLVAISISRKEKRKPFLDFHFVVRGAINFVNETNLSALRFTNCTIVPDRFYYFDKDVSAKRENLADGNNVELCVFPDLEIKFF